MVYSVSNRNRDIYQRPPPEDIQKRKVDFVFRTLQHQFSSQPSHVSLRPFKAIYHLATNCLPEFIKCTLDTLYRDRYADSAGIGLVTSCVNSFCVFSSIFMGLQNTKRVVKLINIEPQFSFNFTLPSGNKFILNTLFVFAGNATQSISEDPNYITLNKSEKQKRVHALVRPQRQEFYKYIQEYVNKKFKSKDVSDAYVRSEILKLVKTSRFKFNQSVINSLRDSFMENSIKVNRNKSFIYCIKTKLPLIRENQIESEIEHAILIEQFYCPLSDSIRYRLYQSWVNVATILDELTKYSGKSWNKGQLDTFLESLEEYYCSETGNLESKKALACFGFGYEQKYYPLVISHNDTIAGTSVRYIFKEFDPKDCTVHLQNIVETIKK